MHGKRVVVTGVIAGESRQTAEQKLREAGALVSSSVTKDTDLLVCGGKVGKTKTRKAEALGVAIVTWEQLWSGSPRDRPVPIGTVVLAEARQIGPMLAKAGELPVGPDWLYEVKWDGYRCIATVKDGAVALQSRSGRSEYAEQFPHVARELRSLVDCVIDGELVVLDENSHSSIERMDTKAGASYVVFDVLEVFGQDVRGLPLEDRRNLLDDLLAPSGTFDLDHITTSPVFESGEELLHWAREEKLEGIVAKKRRSHYREGSRAGEWVKVKLRLEQEFAVVGWVPGEGSMAGAAGSLVLAVYDGEQFVCCGRVGTGREYELWQSFTELPMAAPGAPVAFDLNGYLPPKAIVWVELGLVVQVRFQRWTEDGRLWHPSLVGVRTDKAPTDCRRES